MQYYTAGVGFENFIFFPLLDALFSSCQTACVDDIKQLPLELFLKMLPAVYAA